MKESTIIHQGVRLSSRSETLGREKVRGTVGVVSTQRVSSTTMGPPLSGKQHPTATGSTVVLEMRNTLSTTLVIEAISVASIHDAF